MGTRGPAPKRTDKRLGHRGKEEPKPVKMAAGEKAEAPEPDEGWHPVARRWFDALLGSPQRVYYQESDWALAWRTAESMHREFSDQVVVTKAGDAVAVQGRPNGAVMQSWRAAEAVLLVAEGDRRRAGLEIDPPKPEVEEPPVVSLAAWRESLSS